MKESKDLKKLFIGGQSSQPNIIKEVKETKEAYLIKEAKETGVLFTDNKDFNKDKRPTVVPMQEIMSKVKNGNPQPEKEKKSFKSEQNNEKKLASANSSDQMANNPEIKKVSINKNEKHSIPMVNNLKNFILPKSKSTIEEISGHKVLDEDKEKLDKNFNDDVKPRKYTEASNVKKQKSQSKDKKLDSKDNVNNVKNSQEYKQILHAKNKMEEILGEQEVSPYNKPVSELLFEFYHISLSSISIFYFLIDLYS